MAEQKFYNGRQSQLLTREDEQSGKVIMVKMAEDGPSSGMAALALINEYQVLENLHIKGVRQVIGLEQKNKMPVLLMEYIEGNTLAKYFEDGHHELEDFLKIAIDIVEVLDNIHRERIIHKDVNPENILVCKEDKSIRLIDFGLAGRMQLKLEHLGNPEKLHGNLKYISPEQTGRMDRVIDNRSDLYSLGVSFYGIITGHLPFDGKSHRNSFTLIWHNFPNHLKILITHLSLKMLRFLAF